MHWIDNRKMTVALELKGHFTMQMEVHPSLLIKVFTERVAKKIGIPVERFRLTYGKWKFTDLWQIGDYNIQEGTFIDIHVNFSGGGKDNNDKGNNDKVNTPIQLPSCPVSCPVFSEWKRESPRNGTDSIGYYEICKYSGRRIYTEIEASSMRNFYLYPSDTEDEKPPVKDIQDTSSGAVEHDKDNDKEKQK